MPQRGLLRRNQFLRQLAPLFGERRHPRENCPVRTNQVQAGKHDGHQRRRQKKIQLPLHAIVNLLDLQSGLLLAFIILHQQPRNRRAQRRLPRLQRQSNLLSGFLILPAACQREHALHGVPELRQLLSEILPLLGRAICRRVLFLYSQRGIQISAQAFELRLPRAQRVGLSGIQHVAHRQRHGVQIVLQSQ